MQLSHDYRKCVAFIGTGDNAGFKAFGTGFFLRYDDVVYLVTAQHNIAPLGDNPFTIRVNHQAGDRPLDVHFDPLGTERDHRWFVSEDKSVDLAVIQAGNWRKLGADTLWIEQEHMLPESRFSEERVGIGAFCYAIGLFRLMSGKRRNLPIVHTGHVAMLPGDERIPVNNWRRDAGDLREPVSVDFQGYLVEMTSLEGLSGSPVFVRPVIRTPSDDWEDGRSRDVLVVESQVYLMGVWRSAWGGDASEALKADIGDHKVPVGIGTVEPVDTLIALLESDPVVSARKILHAKWTAQEATTND